MLAVKRFIPSFVRRALRQGHHLSAILLLRKISVAGVRLHVGGLSFHMRSILFHQQYEFCEMELCRRYIRPDDTILEIGSGIGFLGLFCLKYLHVAQVTSVEPSPSTIELLKRNYALNGFKAHVIEAAVSSSEREGRLIAGKDFWSNRVVKSVSSQVTTGQSIPCVTLKTLFDLGSEPFTVLILDIEGSESEVDWRSIPQSVRLIILEMHWHLLDCAAAKRVFDEIAESGFCEVERLGDVVAFTR
jgi:FkbM family methyltransferase